MSTKGSARAVLFCAKETDTGENRVAVTPESARRMLDLGWEVGMEEGAGTAAGYGDADYAAAGAVVGVERAAGIVAADLIASVRCLPLSDLQKLTSRQTTISFLDPFLHPERVRALAECGAQSVSLELIPRTTLAQKMDALSSQASLAGYAAVLLAALRLDKILPMMMTPAGTLQPARFLVVGVGVAGLQAIATAKRLGARVTAFDTRPVVEEQVKSLGAKFLKIDLGETGQTAQGYAKELTPEQIEKQRAGMAKACAEADAVITTAQVFGRPAPRIITRSMIEGMRPGSVVVDMAVRPAGAAPEGNEAGGANVGGNVEGTEPDREVVHQGVRLWGAGNLASQVPRDASAALASNIANYLTHFWDGERGLVLDGDDEISRGSVLTRQGQILSERVRDLLGPTATSTPS